MTNINISHLYYIFITGVIFYQFFIVFCGSSCFTGGYGGVGGEGICGNFGRIPVEVLDFGGFVIAGSYRGRQIRRSYKNARGRLDQNRKCNQNNHR